MDPIVRAQLHRAQSALANASRPNYAKDFIQAVQCLALSDSPSEASFLASNRFAGSKAANFLERGLISTGSVTGADADFDIAQHDFLALVAKRSIIGKINAVRPLRRTQFHQRELIQTERSKAAWVGEGKAIPTTGGKFAIKTLEPAKIGALLPITREVAGSRFEDGLERDLTRAIATAESTGFIDPGNAGNEFEPASVTYNAPTIPSSGNTANDVRADIAALFNLYQGDTDSAVIVMHSRDAVQLGLMQSVLGQANITLDGGDLFGIPLVTSDYVPTDSSGTSVTMLDADQVLFADEGLAIDTSEVAAIEVDDGIWNAFQQNLAVLRAIRRVNWERVRDNAVAVLTGVNWGA